MDSAENKGIQQSLIRPLQVSHLKVIHQESVESETSMALSSLADILGDHEDMLHWCTQSSCIIWRPCMHAEGMRSALWIHVAQLFSYERDELLPTFWAGMKTCCMMHAIQLQHVKDLHAWRRMSIPNKTYSAQTHVDKSARFVTRQVACARNLRSIWKHLRSVSKEQETFQDRNCIPTSEHLLWNNNNSVLIISRPWLGLLLWKMSL